LARHQPTGLAHSSCLRRRGVEPARPPNVVDHYAGLFAAVAVGLRRSVPISLTIPSTTRHPAEADADVIALQGARNPAA